MTAQTSSSKKGFTTFSSHPKKGFTTFSSHKRGFTLIELMIAIAIVAILATVGMLMYSSAQKSAKDAKRKADLEDIKNAVYLTKTGSGTWCKVASGCSGTTWSASVNDSVRGMESNTAGSLKDVMVTTGYLKAAAHDPYCPVGVCISGWNDYWLSIADDTNFTIHAKLDVDAPEIGCTPLSGYNFCITQ